MPGKDPDVARQKARERGRRYREKNRPEDWVDGRGRHGNTPKGENHYRWAGEKIVSSHGYSKVRVGKDHHLADPNGYAYEHQIVAERKIGRKLEVGEVIHHINGNKKDNSPENLAVLAGHREHALVHAQEKTGAFRSGQGEDALGRLYKEYPEVPA